MGPEEPEEPEEMVRRWRRRIYGPGSNLADHRLIEVVGRHVEIRRFSWLLPFLLLRLCREQGLDEWAGANADPRWPRTRPTSRLPP